MTTESLTREIMALAETPAAVWFVELAYQEGDSGHAVGAVYARKPQAALGEVPAHILATNDTLSSIWASPSGAVWVASANGQVATTARVSWPAAAQASKFSYTSIDPQTPWSVTTLPPLRANGLPPNITTLWGTDDQHVFVGTYGGHIYFWNGAQWAQTFEGPGQGQGTIRAFAGTRPDDVFAVGQNGVLLHFNGSGWRALAVAGDPNGRESFTGIHVFANGDALISASGNQGRLVQGTAAGLVEFTRTPLQLIDLVVVGERVLLATGDGVAELFGKDIRMVKSNFMTATSWPGIGRAFFVEPAQTVPSYIEHDPRNADRAWVRKKY